MKSRVITIAVVASLFALTGCGGGGKSAVTGGRTPTDAGASSPTASPSTGSAQLLVSGGQLGAMANASIHTSPGTLCSIVYTHPSGQVSTAQGLDPKTAGPDGNVSWSWLINPTTTLGSGNVSVTCGSDQASAPITIEPVPVPADSKLSVQGGAPGTVASATMHASPGASCSITYTHPSGQASVADGLGPKTVGVDGTVSWSWAISNRTIPGTGTVAVTCDSDQASVPIVIGPPANPPGNP